MFSTVHYSTLLNDRQTCLNLKKGSKDQHKIRYFLSVIYSIDHFVAAYQAPGK
jgi:hypothetical protein